MEHYTLVVSDIHLSRVIANEAPYLTYRQPRFLPDNDLARLIINIAGLSRGTREGGIEIVFNGDIFDFDASDPAVPRGYRPGEARVHETANNAASSVRRIAHILNDHPMFVNAVRFALNQGCNVVFIAGNHDAQLNFPQVQQFLRHHAFACPAESGATGQQGVTLRTWFHQTRDGIHIEHGHLYDPFCTLNLPEPHEQLEDTMGSVTARYLPAMFPNMNPHAVNPFPAFGGTSQGPKELLATWMSTQDDGVAGVAAAKFLRGLMTVEGHPIQKDSLVRAAAAETGADIQKITRHASLLPAKGNFADFVRGKEWSDYAGKTSRRLQQASRHIASIYGARAVVMGHTHDAYGLRESGIFFGNSGSWTPAAPGFDTKTPAESEFDDKKKGSFIWLKSSPGELIRGGAFDWTDRGVFPVAQPITWAYPAGLSRQRRE